ncbi:MAG TPA: histidine phosphatase family protein [Dehalococcoidia bacterium]|nr:histidine phosphatase family protein [Dehalococcoidia bacterium]
MDVYELRAQGEGEPVKLLLIRHGESQGNHEGRLQGRREFPLTERGREQCEALAGRMTTLPVSAIYSSPIRRAHDTALFVGSELGLEVTLEPRVQEYDFGERLSGLTWQEIREQQPEIVKALASGQSEFPRYPGEEGRAAFHQRVCAAIGDIADRHREDPAVAVVTHAGPIVVYVLDTLGRGYSRPIPFTIENTSITTIELNNGAAAPFAPASAIVGLNDTCHLSGLEPRAKLRLD